MPARDDRSSHPETRAASRRRSIRTPFRGLVAVDAPELADQPWVVDAIDLNSLGMGLVLPAELVEGTRVLLSFKLADGLEFSRVPATIAHYGPAASGGGVRFEPWPEEERLQLLEYLVASYESAGEG